MLLARDSIVGIFIPSSISLPSSLFTHSVIHHPATNSLVALLARLIVMCITERGQRYLSVIRSDKSQSRSVSTQQILSKIPVMHLYSHPVTLWRLIHPKYSYGIQELHALMVKGRDTWHWQSSSKWTTRSFLLVLGLGLVHHIILLMMWSRYQRHPMSIARKPWLSVDHNELVN